MSLTIKVIDETRDYIVIHKPSGVECEHEVMRLLDQQLYCVHRLDTPTSGLIVYAKTKNFAKALSQQIQSHQMTKIYHAIISGRLADEGELTDLLYRDRRSNKAYVVKRVRKGVKEARAIYRTLDVSNELSLVEVTLKTGRFHQIRVQCASRGHPIAGDGKYGSRIKSSHIALCCVQLGFICHDQFITYTTQPEADELWAQFISMKEKSLP